MWNRFIWLFLLLLLGYHHCIPSSPRYMELADSADYFIARENWDRAEKSIIEAMRLEPASFTNSLLLANLGLIQSQKGEYKKALESLSLGLNIAPSSTVLLNNRAHTYILMDSIDAAIRDIDKSLSLDSLQEWTLQTRAFLYLQEEDMENAEILFNKVKTLFPSNSGVYAGLATVAEKKDQTDTALILYKTSLDLNPGDEETREAYIFLLIKTENFSNARAEIRKALDINPENPMFYLLRGYLHRLNYRPEEALADKKIAIAKGLAPDYVSSFIP